MLKVNPDDFRSALAAKLAKPLFGNDVRRGPPAARAQVPLLICEIQSEKVAVASTAWLAIKKRASFRGG
jgi:hypothetical protein